MFGYVLPDKPNMFMKDYAEYRAFYCGLCKSIGKKCSEVMRFTTNYDITFLNVLYHAIFDYIWEAPSLMTIFQLQDLLKLDDRARINSPGTTNDDNWAWKLKDFSWMKKIQYGQ